MKYVSKIDTECLEYSVTDTDLNKTVVYTQITELFLDAAMEEIRGINFNKKRLHDYSKTLKAEYLASRDKILGVVDDYTFDEDWYIVPVYNKTKRSIIVIPDWAESLQSYTFSERDSLISVTCGKSMRVIGEDALNSAYNLETFIFNEGLRRIELCAFFGAYLLSSINLPESLNSIGTCAFLDCRSLRSVKIPSLVTVISASCFSDCIGLRSIELPDTCTSIEKQAFKECTHLRQVDLGKGIKTIGFNAFINNVSLKSITINKGDTLERNAFDKDIQLKRIK